MSIHGTTSFNPPTLVRMSHLIEDLGLSRSHIYRLMADGRFPKSVSLVPGGTSVAWVSSEIQAWIDERIAERDQEVEA